MAHASMQEGRCPQWPWWVQLEKPPKEDQPKGRPKDLSKDSATSLPQYQKTQIPKVAGTEGQGRETETEPRPVKKDQKISPMSQLKVPQAEAQC